MNLDFCTLSSPIWRLVGYFLYIVKVVIPLIIIILEAIDLSKAVVAGKDDAIKKSTSILIKRLILGIVIFFIPTIVSLILNLISEASPIMEASKGCRACLLDPFKSDCNSTIETKKNARNTF